MTATTQSAAELANPLSNRLDKRGVDDYLIIDAVRKEFDGFVAVDNVSITIRQGEIFALLGASGCGKSTLLRALAGFEQVTAGRIVLAGQDISGLPPYKRPINMMFQSYALFPHMNVEQNVAFGLKQDGMPTPQLTARVAEMLNLVQMSTFAKRKPHQLSGGQQQRVALARSLAKSPKLLLLDEPMGALDKKLRSQMQLELVDIIEQLGVTCVMVTHDQEEAMTMAHRIAVMESGRIRQIGSPDEIYEQPNSRYTAQFIGSVNLFEGKIDKDEQDFVTIQSAALADPIHVAHGVTGFTGMAVAFALRPEKVRIGKDEPTEPHNKAHGTIEDIAYFGSHSVYHVRLDSGSKVLCNFVNKRRWDSEGFTWNDPVWVSWGELEGVVLTS